MEVFALLKSEDDNPRGQAGGRFVNGSTLEEAAAAEQRRVEIKASKWSKGKQEEGIIHLIQSRTLFQRLKLPEPRLANGTARWDVSEEQVQAAYDDLKKCCHPEWSFHPQRDRGYTLLREAVDTLSNASRRNAYVREVVDRIRERETLLAGTGRGGGGIDSSNRAMQGGTSGGGGGGGSSAGTSSRAALAAAAAADAAEIEEQSKRHRLMVEEKRRVQATANTTLAWRESQLVAAAPGAEDEEEEEEEAAATGSAAARLTRDRLKAANKATKKRRPGMF